MLEYSFLTLSLILAVPGLIVWATRPDLRATIRRMVLLSLPFGLTERLFYPEYWKPRFLFDLVEVIGFGLEDLLFVAGLAAFSSTAWAFMTGDTIMPSGVRHESPWRRALGLITLTFVSVGALALLSFPMIYGAPIIMIGVGTGICALRPDLWRAGLGGATITLLLYTGACLLLAALIPDVFELDWNTERFLNIFVLGVPIEELIYAWTSGFIATVFHPFAFGNTYAPSPGPSD